ncbi:MAG: hypothetical protein JXO51_01700 [Candidatus Aminicenantes bacterium]|nr:hypothetical protein [Candidatus Aminicenantes bacterium]
MKKKWILGGLVLVVLVAFVFLPSLRAGSEDRVFQQELRRQELRNRIAQMRADIRANGWDFEVDANPAMQYSIEQLCTFKPELKPVDLDYEEDCEEALPTATLPRSYTGYYTPIKNQGSCGSCWAFATIGAQEAAMKKRTGSTYNLSEQYLVSCNSYGYGCDGGWFAFAMCKSPGSILESCFPYTALDSPCSYCSNPTRYKVFSYGSVSTTTSKIKSAIYSYGCVAAAVYVNSYFQAYKSGTFSACQNYSPNHAIILCGWDDSRGAWRLKNSWGTGWGESGFMWIKYGCSRVGYGATRCTYY